MSCTFWNMRRRQRALAKKNAEKTAEKETVTENNSETVEDKPKKSRKRGAK